MVHCFSLYLYLKKKIHFSAGKTVGGGEKGEKERKIETEAKCSRKDKLALVLHSPGF